MTASARQYPSDPQPETSVAYPLRSMRLPSGPDAVPLARSWLAGQVVDVPRGIADDAVLMTSELVGNAVRHGRPEVRLQFELSSTSLRVAVTDHGGPMPVWRPSGPSHVIAPSGRGLLIVDTLASTWGVQPMPASPGKTVWFCVELP